MDTCYLDFVFIVDGIHYVATIFLSADGRSDATDISLGITGRAHFENVASLHSAERTSQIEFFVCHKFHKYYKFDALYVSITNIQNKSEIQK